MNNLIRKLIPTVSKNTLLVVAGMVWVIAGSILLRRSMSFISENNITNLAIGIGAGMLFYYFVFRRIVRKHSQRILLLENERPFIYSFFSGKAYLMMVLMISMGVTLRKSNVIPPAYLAWMFLIMSVPLLISAIHFFVLAAQQRKHIE